MTRQVLYLKTIFCCMACDGDIAKEELELVKSMALETKNLEGLDIEAILNVWISEINNNGALFLKKYLSELSKIQLTDEEQLTIVNIAFKTIEADNKIEYSEVKFFKKIRSRLSISDEQILRNNPDKDDFLLSDINVADDPILENVSFINITL